MNNKIANSIWTRNGTLKLFFVPVVGSRIAVILPGCGTEFPLKASWKKFGCAMGIGALSGSGSSGSGACAGGAIDASGVCGLVSTGLPLMKARCVIPVYSHGCLPIICNWHARTFFIIVCDTKIDDLTTRSRSKNLKSFKSRVVKKMDVKSDDYVLRREAECLLIGFPSVPRGILYFETKNDLLLVHFQNFVELFKTSFTFLTDKNVLYAMRSFHASDALHPVSKALLPA